MNYLVVGLGNIGAEYAQTRHNIGFMTLDFFAKESNVLFSTGRYGDTATVRFRGHSLTLLKPSTYMNLSGKAVRYWMNELNVPLERIIVVCDDLNIPFGTLRMKKQGSNGGHNGLGNINELLGSENYSRIRMGIGNDFARGAQVNYVLGSFSEDEMKQIPELAARVVQGIKDFVNMGPDRAMNVLNTKKKTENQ